MNGLWTASQDHWQYLALMGACLLVTLPLELLLRARVYAQPRRLLRAVLPVTLIFTTWDAAAIARGHWAYSPRYTTGWRLPFSIPVEELVFFVAIPLCGLLTYEAVGTVVEQARRHLGSERSQEVDDDA